jgi:hypothetical protein
MHSPGYLHEGYDYREHGYWHIARTQVMRASEITHKLEAHTKIQSCYHDDSRLMRGGLLEVTFEPVFVRHKKLRQRKIQPQGYLVIPPQPVQPRSEDEIPPPPVPERKRRKPKFADPPPLNE